MVGNLPTWIAIVATAACGRFDLDHPARPDATSADAPRDAELVADAAVDAAPSVCGSVVALQDDFNAIARAAQWNFATTNGMTIGQGGGTLTATYPASTPASSTAQYSQANLVDFRGGCTTVQLGLIPNTATSAYGFAVMSDVSIGVGFETVQGQLQAVYYTSSTTATALGMAAYDPIAHHVARIRENNGTYFWETSKDGVTFAPFAQSATTGVAATQLRIQVGAATSSAVVTNGGKATYGTVLALTH
jgi:hypothetical protein